MATTLKLTDRRAITDWEGYLNDIISSTSVDPSESESDKYKRIKKLEADPEEWFKYYFPKYCYAEPARFHKQATKRILEHDTWYEVRAWSRELAKSSRAMMEITYMALTGKVKNVVLVSHSADQAEKLLKPFFINFEFNGRIINDYGQQRKDGSWTSTLFVCNCGCSFASIGAGQSPRGFKNEEIRPDVLLIDDIDTDEECRNQRMIDQKFKWIEEALIFSMSVSRNKRILFLGNIIAKESCIVKASRKADHFSIVNIRDKNGVSVWPEKNSEEQIDWMLSKVSYAAGQKEFYNNPVSQGTVFKEIRWDKCPPLSQFKFVIAYGDPATSNKDNKANCYKAMPLIGILNGTLYVFTAFVEQVKNAIFIGWYFDIDAYVGSKTQLYNYIENNTLQDPFFEQVFTPLINEECKNRGKLVHVVGDDRKKPGKFERMEGNLEPLNRTGRLIFNIEEKNNPHMQRLEEQFKAVEPLLSAPVDGPDAVEGGYWIANNKLAVLRPVTVGQRTRTGKNHY